MESDSDVGRLLAALRCENNAGRVPNFEITMGVRNLSAILNRSVDEGLGGVPADIAVEAALAIRQDAIPCLIRLPNNPEARAIPSGSIQTMEDFERVAIMPGFKGIRIKIRQYLNAVQHTGLGVCACLSGPFTQSCMAAGPVPIESFMLMIYDAPDLVTRMLDFFTEYSLLTIAATKDLPFHFYYIGDDVTGFVSPAHLRALWKPRQEMIITAAKATGRPVLCHCCGPVADILPFLAEWKVDALHPIQASINDIYSIHKQYPRLALVGNIDINLLSSGTPEEVSADTDEHIARLAGGGGYIVCSSHSIINSVKPENFRAMLERAWATRRP